MPALDKKSMNRMRFFQLRGLIVVCVLAFSVPSVAQPSEPKPSGPQPAAALTNPAVSLNELAHRLVPLTKAELEPLANAWLAIVRIKTEEIAESQVELLHDPSAATEEAYQEIAAMVEVRAGLFERLSMVVNALESKG